MTTPSEPLGARIRQHALRLGFDRVGIAPLHESEHVAFYRRWLDARRHGEMHYLARPDAVARRADPRAAWPALRSAVVVALHYDPGEATDGPGASREAAGADDVAYDGGVGVRRAPRATGNATPATRGDPSRGIIARYARGRDYHKVMKKKLFALLRSIEAEVGRELPAARAYVDTGPVLERELARRAGLGWFGRNTMLIHPRAGSYFFIGTLLVELELEPDTPFEADRCGTCTACIDACPTGALLGRDEDGAPVIDATRCISYLTIEQRGPIPRELRPLIGNRVFGCDICQEVCPWNGPRFVRITREPAFAARGPGEPPVGVQQVDRRAGHPGTDTPSLVDLLRTALDENRWEPFSRGSAIRRAGRAGFARNVCVAIGNWLADLDEPPADAVEVLEEALLDEEPLVREHATWALRKAQ